MPRIADLEIAATWDEIELEAALRSRGAEALEAPSAEASASTLADVLRTLEALKQLPRDERKRRAEELLRTLTSTAPASSPVPEPAPESLEPSAEDLAPSAEALAVAEEPPPLEPPLSADAAVVSAAVSEPKPVVAEPVSAEPVAPEPASAEPVAAEPPSDETVAVAPEASPPPSEDPSGDAPQAIAAALLSLSEEPLIAAPVEAPAEVFEPQVSAPVSADPVPGDATPDASEPSAVESAAEAIATEPAVAEAPAVADPAPSAPILEPVQEVAPEPAPAVSRQPDAIPKFLATECAVLEPEHPDSLIPLRAVAAAGALIGAVLLVYFWSSQEFGLAARPIMGASESAQAHAVAPRISASLAARQAFVALPPDFATGPQSPRPYRPAFVGFDFFDDPAPPASAAKAEAAPTPTQAALVMPQASADETTAPTPPSPGSDAEALIKRGDDLLKAGDIAAARSAYERAAAGGSAKAQIGVGKTYDPLVLAKLGTRGVRGDPVQAASWYARASEAGDAEGQQSLHALISGLSDCMLGQGSCGNKKP